MCPPLLLEANKTLPSVRHLSDTEAVCGKAANFEEYDSSNRKLEIHPKDETPIIEITEASYVKICLMDAGLLDNPS